MVDTAGIVHAVYLKGDPRSADVVYIRSSDYGKSFSEPLRVNSQPGSAIAAGAIRGAQFAVGRNGRVHVAWNGSSTAQPRGPLSPEMSQDSPHNGVPMLYSRLNDKGMFEPQRNLMRKTFGLDGGGSVAADAEGNVYVAWHGQAAGASEGEGGRRVWLARSSDDGETFAEERAIFDQPTGACSCCGMRLFADSNGNLLALYRSARDVVHRDVYLLASTDRGETFRGKMLHPWEIGACPMSSMFFLEGAHGLLAAWETAEQVFFSAIDVESLRTSEPVAAPERPVGENIPSRRKIKLDERSLSGQRATAGANPETSTGRSSLWTEHQKASRAISSIYRSGPFRLPLPTRTAASQFFIEPRQNVAFVSTRQRTSASVKPSP